MALQSACKESLERDAAMRGCYEPAAARRTNAASFTHGGGAVGRIVTELSDVGVEFHLVQFDTIGAGEVVMALVLDHDHGVVGAGLGLEPLAAQSVLRAVQESLQIRTLLIDMKRLEAISAPDLPILREIDRALFWASDRAIDAAKSWLAHVPAGDLAVDRAAAVSDWRSLVGRTRPST